MNNLKENDRNVSKDPLYYKNLIGKKVEVKTLDDKLHTGDFYCYDPVSESIVLVNKTSDTYSTDILVGYAVKELKIVSEEVNSDVIFKSSEKFASEDLSELKNKIKDCLKKNLINFEEIEDVFKIGDDLTILPPYTMEKCISSNTIILQRVQDILSKMS